MNVTLCSSTESDLAICDLSFMTEDLYATAPMAVVVPKQAPVDEEVIYNSFEEALSDRLTAFHDHWNYQSNGQLMRVQPTTDPLLVPSASTHTESLALLTNETTPAWLQQIIFGCLILISLMSGLDLMELLILHIR